MPLATEKANVVMDSSAEGYVMGITRSWEEALELCSDLTNFCHDFYEEPNVQGLLNSNTKFDLLITFSLFDGCGLSLGQHLGINNTVLHAPGPFLTPIQLARFGIPIYASSYKINGIKLSDSRQLRKSILARAVELIKGTVAYAINSVLWRYCIDSVAHKHLPSYTGYQNLYGSTRMIFMNYHPHPLVDQPFPLGPGVINLGGTTCKTHYNSHEIEQPLKDFVDLSPGFILISFGSHVKSLSEEEVQLWVEVFSQLPYQIVWRLTGHSTALTDNIMTSEWLPQQALLLHPNVKLFITHGGYASKIEAVCAGVPMLFVPRFAEQFDSAQYNTEIGMAEQVIMKPGQTTVGEIATKISKTVRQCTFKMKELSSQIRKTRVTDQQVMGYLGMAVSGHSLFPGYQPWWQLFYLDIILVPLATIMLIRYLIRRLSLARTIL